MCWVWGCRRERRPKLYKRTLQRLRGRGAKLLRGVLLRKGKRGFIQQREQVFVVDLPFFFFGIQDLDLLTKPLTNPQFLTNKAIHYLALQKIFRLISRMFSEYQKKGIANKQGFSPPTI